MKRPKHSMALLTAAILLLSGCTVPAAQTTPSAATTPPYVSLEQAQQDFLSKVDVDYSFALAQQMSVIRDNEILGYRTAGSPADLEGLDVTGKLVLVDINQRDDWWINYPTYEASLRGAAVVAAQDGGYGEVSPDALIAQDICGPKDAPALSISRTDADRILAALGETTVTLNAKSTVAERGESFNIVGTIPGRDPESMVLMSAHYDSYFEGFQDDNAAIALMLGIAKAIVDSGYQPEKTLVFCAPAAEEWGAVNTRYDWSTGAYNQIFRVHPEWAGKVVANLNFELPAMNEGETDQIRTAYELRTFTQGFAPSSCGKMAGRKKSNRGNV